MKDNMYEAIKKAKTAVLKTVKEKKPVLILAAGLLGIVLILFSELSGGEKTQQTAPDNIIEDYENRLSAQLGELIAQIDGAGRTSLMLTLECGEESVYARDSSENTQKQNNSSEDENVEQTDTNIEYKYIIIESTGSTEDGLRLMTLKPRVRGVAVVCDGGDSAVVRAQITEAVCAVLAVSAARVSVAKMTA